MQFLVSLVCSVVVAGLSGCVSGPRALTSPTVDSQLDSLRAELERVRQTFRVPGMAVVAIQDGRVVFREGFGYRHVEAQKPFTPDTICLVASTTKSFTAGLTGILVEEGTVDWTKPVREYWPEFKMVDDFATREMTLEDMMCHRSGLPDHENLLAHGVGRELPDKGSEYRRELLRRLAHFEPSHSFRTHFQYQDIIFTCAGAILEHVTGESYEKLVSQRIFGPLGMKDSTFSRREARQTGRLAQGYGVVEEEVKPIPHCDTRYFAPSGGLYTSAEEMIKWVQLQIDRGKVGSRQIISEENMKWIHRPHMNAGPLSDFVGGGLLTYGQGWFQSNVRGHVMMSHGGSFNGYRTNIAFVPDKKIGVVVLCNLNLSTAMWAASFVTLDRLLGFDEVDARIAYYRNLEKMAAGAEALADREFASGRDVTKKPRYALRQYAGSFHHPGYGTFEVDLKDGSLRQTYDGRSFEVKPYNGETFVTRYQSTENHIHHMTMTFESDGKGRVVAVRIPLVPGIETPRFVRED